MAVKAKDQFTQGYLLATAHVARRGEETIAVEMLREIGITTVTELREAEMESFDFAPLRRVLMNA